MYLTYQRFGWLTQLKINIHLFRIEKQLFRYEKRKILNFDVLYKKVSSRETSKSPKHDITKV